MEKYEWKYSIIGFDTYGEKAGLFECEILLQPKWWEIWRKKKTVVIVGDANGFYDATLGIRVPKEMNDNVCEWFRSWHTRWLAEAAVL